MVTITGHKRAIGTFSDHADAEASLRELKDSGFPMNMVSIVGQDIDRKSNMAGAEGSDRLSILTGFEYRFHHNGDKIAGGRELLDTLVKSASRYAQTLQSAEPVLIDRGLISLEPVDAYIHKLKVKSSDRSESLESIEINLSTVQLFDLVESIDRLCLDPQNLLDFNPAIAPATSPSRNVVSYLPAFIGVGSLAIASTIG